MNTLSILIISHNQRDQLRRCVESVLSQDLPFEHEIVISDDASSDGTWELAQEYARTFEYVKAYQCNSNDCNPTTTSERSGHNRSNAYLHSSGKYFVHIDADDFYRPGTDCLRRQVELLEEHHECSMCMQDEWCWEEGDPLEKGHSTHPMHRFKTGQIITEEFYFREDILVNNAVMMMRRHEDVNPADLYRKWYVDTIITAHHLQYGPIVCLDRNDWIYSQSPQTITNAIKKNDRMLLWGLNETVLSAILVPGLTRYYYYSRYSLGMLLDAVRIIMAGSEISDYVVTFCHQFDKKFVFRAAASPSLTAIDRFRLMVLRNIIKFVLKHNLCGNKICSLALHYLCV